MSNVEVLRRLRAEARKNGMCNTCRCRPVEPGRATCRTCLDAKKSIAAANVAAGRCSCGRKRSVGSDRGKPYRSCRKCRIRRRKEANERRRTRIAIGLCYCGAPVVEKRKRCQKHLLTGATNARKAHLKKRQAVT